MGLPVEVNNLMMGSLGGYNINRSLRFRSSASAYLNRTPSSSGNRKTWTYSAWIKRGASASGFSFLSQYTDSNNQSQAKIRDSATGTNPDTVRFYDLAANVFTTDIYWSPVYRDFSGWYHLMLVADTTQATNTNRIKLYINGVQVTSTISATWPSQNTDLRINLNAAHFIGQNGAGGEYADGYLAEVNFIDGQALTPSSFGAYDTNGVWQPKKYTGTYGTNGFYLPFSNTTSTTTLVQDSSGNGNNWTPNNISLTAGTTYDSMIDSPTVSASASNYAVLNPINNANGVSLTAGNLTFAVTSSNGSVPSTISASSGKWYAEMYNIQSSSSLSCGIGAAPVSTFPYNNYLGSSSNQCSFWKGGGGGSPFYYVNASVATAYQATAGDVGLIAVDIDNGKMWAGLLRSGTTYWFNSSGGTTGDPATGANPCATFTVGTAMYIGATGQTMSSSTSSINFGQQGFSGTAPSGFKALNTYNLPAATINNGALYMAATTYTGTGSVRSISNSVNGVSMNPDLIWVKNRNSTQSHIWTDSVRGTTKQLYSNTTSSEGSDSNAVTAFNSDGFSLGTDAGGIGVNTNTNTYVAWQWKAGGTGVTNNSGTITSTVSANPTAGFSIVTYTGTGANATVGHGLGVAPSMVIVKRRSAAEAWGVYHTSLGATQAINLELTAAAYTYAIAWNNTAPTSSVFSLGTWAAVNSSAGTFVAYCFAAVSGYSAFSSYVGNGSADGPFVFTGFRPRFLLIKSSTTAHAWEMFDTSRDTYNAAYQELDANSSNAEYTAAGGQLDILSNGFKVRYGSSGFLNASGQTYIYAAFAENPLKFSRAR